MSTKKQRANGGIRYEEDKTKDIKGSNSSSGFRAAHVYDIP